MIASTPPTTSRANYQRRLLLTLGPAIGPLLKQYFQPNCCIVATRIVVDLCDALDIDASPVVARMAAYSRGWRVIMEDGRTPTKAEMDAAPDVWSVGLGVSPEPGDEPQDIPPDAELFIGHLVALVTLDDGQQWIVDASAGQGHRPDKGVHLPDTLVIPIPHGLVWRPGQEVAAEDATSGTLVVYDWRVDPPAFRHAKDWQASRARPFVRALLRYIREEVSTWANPAAREA